MPVICPFESPTGCQERRAVTSSSTTLRLVPHDITARQLRANKGCYRLTGSTIAQPIEITEQPSCTVRFEYDLSCETYLLSFRYSVLPSFD